MVRLGQSAFVRTLQIRNFHHKFQNAHLCCLQSLRTSHRASFRMVLDTITTCDTGAMCTMNFFLVLLVGLRNSRATCCDVGVIVAVIFDDCAKLSISSTAAMAKNSRIIVLAPILAMKCPWLNDSKLNTSHRIVTHCFRTIIIGFRISRS